MAFSLFAREGFEVTQERLAAPWSGARDGRYFRCYLCGRFFELGDRVRAVYSNFPGSPFDGNPLVCVQRRECSWSAMADEEILKELAARASIVWWANPKPRPGCPRDFRHDAGA